jgi:transposase
VIAVGNRRLYLYADAVDMRKGIDGLASIVLSGLQRDPSCGDIFIFVGRRRNLLKALCWDGDGYWLVLRRLAEGRFLTPRITRSDGSPTALEMNETDWHLLLDGIVIRDRVLLRRHKRSSVAMIAAGGGP